MADPEYERRLPLEIKPITVPLMRAHELLGSGSRSQFKKVYVDTGLVKPIDVGARGLSVVIDEVHAAVRQRIADIRSGKIAPSPRTSRALKVVQSKARSRP
jgi:hypothetical protein